MAARTYLFVPGNRAERYAKAFASAADVVVLDLEDAVIPQDKAAARDAIGRWADAATPSERERAAVRINDVNTQAFSDDLRLAVEAGLTRIMLPKAEGADHVDAVAAVVPGACVLPLLETARGIANARDVAEGATVSRLVLGTLDLALDLELDIAQDPQALTYAAGCLVIASRIAGLDAPIAGVTPQLDDEARLLSDLRWERRHGFGAKLCIHPRQVAPIHAALAPSVTELEWARRVLAAEAASPGAARLDGRMIDRPVVLQAQRTLQRADT